MVLPQEHGKLFSVMACFEVMTVFAAISLLNLAYQYTVSITPGFTFRIMACVGVFPFLFGIILWWCAPKSSCHHDADGTDHQGSFQTDTGKENPVYFNSLQSARDSIQQSGV